MVVPPKHPKMIIFSRKTHGCWVPPFEETPHIGIKINQYKDPYQPTQSLGNLGAYCAMVEDRLIRPNQ